MTIVLDTDVLLRTYDKSAPQHPTAMSAIAGLEEHGETLRTLPQCFYEFWVVATRPIAANGLGLEPAECSLVIRELRKLFPLIVDHDIFDVWLELVAAHACRGKIAHDAPDFARFPGIVVLNPADVAATFPTTTTPE